MNQREVIRQSWARRKKAAVLSSHFNKADEFFQMIEEQSDLCWEDLANEFRRNYYDAFDLIVPTLLDTDDPLITYNCIRFSDQNQPKEIAALQHIARESDSERHQVTLLTLANTKKKELTTVLRGRKDLPQAVRLTLRSPSAAPAAGEKKEVE